MTNLDLIVNRHILSNHTMLIMDLLKHGLVSYDDVINSSADKEIYEFWEVSDWLAKKLIQHNEPVLESDYGYFWGRCCTGQAIEMDGIIQEIAKEMRQEND